eukprot:SAG22_NODE_20569_length_264_cov_1.230303_1_plen_59_part_10
MSWRPLKSAPYELVLYYALVHTKFSIVPWELQPGTVESQPGAPSPRGTNADHWRWAARR